MAEWQIYQAKMVRMARQIRKIFGDDAKVTLSCDLTSATPHLWTATVKNKHGKEESIQTEFPGVAVEQLLDFLKQPD
jgi:hypothetical protein